ncbi:hypothetical protein V2J09_018761 [Rumex salicifolius]
MEILLSNVKVSVPCNNMMEMVTVRCGHCTRLWSVNMATAFSHHPPLPLPLPHPHLLQAFNYNNSTQRASNNVMGSSSRYFAHKTAARSPPPMNLPSHREERVVNRPPEKRQRVPSAYNQFIKEEIQRIKANNPLITHREAFSTAAKNWAHFPHIQFGLMLETNNQPKL